MLCYNIKKNLFTYNIVIIINSKICVERIVIKFVELQMFYFLVFFFFFLNSIYIFLYSFFDCDFYLCFLNLLY